MKYLEWYSCWENPRDRGVWWTTVHEVAQSWTWPSTHTHLEWNWYATGLLRLLPVHHICYILFIYNLTWSPRFQEDSLVSPLYRWGNWGLENLSSLIRLTQVICDSVRLDFKAPSGFPWWLRWEIIFLQCRRPTLELLSNSVEKFCIKSLYAVSHSILISTEWCSEWFLEEVWQLSLREVKWLL